MPRYFSRANVNVMVSAGPKSGAAETSAHFRVLVIDDDSIARELLCTTIEAAGHTTYALPSSIGATRCMFENKVNVVVLDVMMPNINGDKIAKVLRNNPQGEALTIVLVSSRSHDELKGLADAAQADAVVSKRNIRSELVRVLTQAVRRRERQGVRSVG